MNIKEAFETAIRYEARARDIYRKAADRMTDQKTKALFESFSKEESAHLRYMEDSYRLWKETGQIQIGHLHAEDFDAEINDSMDRVRQSLKDAISAQARRDLLSALEKACDVENETHAFYERIIQALQPLDAQLFERFLMEEKKHVNRILDLFEQVKMTNS